MGSHQPRSVWRRAPSRPQYRSIQNPKPKRPCHGRLPFVEGDERGSVGGDSHIQSRRDVPEIGAFQVTGVQDVREFPRHGPVRQNPVDTGDETRRKFDHLPRENSPQFRLQEVGRMQTIESSHPVVQNRRNWLAQGDGSYRRSVYVRAAHSPRSARKRLSAPGRRATVMIGSAGAVERTRTPRRSSSSSRSSMVVGSGASGRISATGFPR